MVCGHDFDRGGRVQSEKSAYVSARNLRNNAVANMGLGSIELRVWRSKHHKTQQGIEHGSSENRKQFRSQSSAMNGFRFRCRKQSSAGINAWRDSSG